MKREDLKESFEKLLIIFQEEATSKWSSEKERTIYQKAYEEVYKEYSKVFLNE